MTPIFVNSGHAKSGEFVLRGGKYVIRSNGYGRLHHSFDKEIRFNPDPEVIELPAGYYVFELVPAVPGDKLTVELGEVLPIKAAGSV